jgi:hypothetical protein
VLVPALGLYIAEAVDAAVAVVPVGVDEFGEVELVELDVVG